MSSHEKYHVPPPEDGLPLIQKDDQWNPNGTEDEQRRRRNPALRFFLTFMVCSMVLLGLASVHSPTFRQRFSCHDGMMGKLKAGAKFKGGSTLTAAMDQEAPQTPNDFVDLNIPNQPKEDQESKQQGGDAHHVGGAPTAGKLHLGKRETNSSSVPFNSGSQTAKTAGSTSGSSEPSSEPSSSAPSQTLEPSPTPSSPSSSGFKTSTTTTPNPPAKSSTTKGPEHTATSTTPPPHTDDTTIYTTRPANPTNAPPTTPKVTIETSTRTSNGQVVIVESTITVQPSATEPGRVTESNRPPPSLQNAATRQEARAMVLAALVVGTMMGILLY